MLFCSYFFILVFINTAQYISTQQNRQSRGFGNNNCANSVAANLRNFQHGNRAGNNPVGGGNHSNHTNRVNMEDSGGQSHLTVCLCTLIQYTYIYIFTTIHPVSVCQRSRRLIVSPNSSDVSECLKARQIIIELVDLRPEIKIL